MAIVNQLLGDDFYALTEEDLNRLNSAVAVELACNPQVHSAIKDRVIGVARRLKKR